ncbi:MAG: ABC transporter permease subunit [Victivallales bacterium]|nr:ABC transporter permease subunit [Victivallales bacterium]
MFSPITKKRLQRFRRLRRAWWSFCLFVALYILTLGAELVCNSRPLAMRFAGRWYFPAFCFYPDDAFTGSGLQTRADYLSLERQGVLKDAWVLWAPVRGDPYRIASPDELSPYLRERIRLNLQPRVAGVTFAQDGTIQQATGFEILALESPENLEIPANLTDCWVLPEDFDAQLASRWKGEAAESLSIHLRPQPKSGWPAVELRFASASARFGGRKTLRARIFEEFSEQTHTGDLRWEFDRGAELPRRNVKAFQELSDDVRSKIASAREKVRRGEEFPVEEIPLGRRTYRLVAEMEAARFPFRPVQGHWLGIDDAGRDVFARIFYGLRIALNFGMILVICSLAGGTLAGMLQGYLGGWTDILGQRFIEIWSALPFLYVMILMGSIYGAGFLLLLVCYALFNWIGISYYMRAETLRLRNLPYVEAAKCLGLSGWRIALRHILPNALVPLITFFPFSLVGAIGSLAALDYLGFGLPAPTPSLGELLSQAQAQRWAWWLVLYPSIALFIVMLLGVFIGEGVRNSFDPRRQQRLQ